MAVISVSTVTTGQTITAALWNTTFATIVNDYNGNITNANVSASAGITSSKIAFGGTTGQYVKSDGSGGLTYANLSINRAFTWGVRDTIPVTNEQGMKYIVPQDMTAIKLWAKTDSGTCSIRVQADTTDISSSFSVSSLVNSTTSFNSTALTAGQVLTLDVLSVSSASGLYVVLEVTQP